MKIRTHIFIFSLIFALTTSYGQEAEPICPTANSATGESDFLSDCPWCIAQTAPNGTQAIPCFLKSVSEGGAWQVNFRYVLIFDDEFEGDAIDLSKWVTSTQTGTVVSDSIASYDNGLGFQFDHPGLELIDNYLHSDSIYYSYNNTYYHYTASGLQSQYQFPMFNNTTYSIISLSHEPIPHDTLYPYSYGIYQLTATLPQVQTYNGGPSSDPPYADTYTKTAGSIWPAFWMWGINETYQHGYGEIDGFEFAKSSLDDIQTVHYNDPDTDYCQNIWGDPTNPNFGDGTQRNFYSIYTPYELDWSENGTINRSDTRFYGENDPLVGDDTYFPIYNPPITSDDVDYIYENCIFPENVPMWLMLGNGVKLRAESQYFPVNFPVQSIKYWVPGNCDNPTDVTKTDIHNYNTLQFNAFTGTTVTIDGITNGAITSTDIPTYRTITTSHDKSPGGFTHGNLEAIAINEVQIIGNFQSAGYLVLKTDGNMCNEYSGPYPFDDVKSSRKPIKRRSEDDSIVVYKSHQKKQDSISLQVSNALTKGQIILNLTNISTDQLNQTADVTVYNMLGQLLYQGKMQVAPDNPFQINLSGYASGVYLVMVKTNNTLLQRKIILQK